jgi:hypothetical protein
MFELVRIAAGASTLTRTPFANSSCDRALASATNPDFATA